jgi:hypothetical protein
MAHGRGDGMIVAGAIVTFVGVCIVLIKVFRVPEYWIPLMVGLGLLLAGFIRRVSARNSRRGP